MSIETTFHGMMWYEEIGFGALTISKHIQPFNMEKSTWSNTIKKQIQAIFDNTGESEESMEGFLEMLEISVKESGPILQLYFFPYEDGSVFIAGSTERLGYFSQGGFDFEEWPETTLEMVQGFRLLLDLAAVVNPLTNGDNIGRFGPGEYLGDILDDSFALFDAPSMKHFQDECQKRGIAIAEQCPDFEMFLMNKNLSERVAKLIESPDFIEKAPSTLDAVAQWYTLDAYHKKLDSSLADTVFNQIFLPIILFTKRCKPEWEILLPRDLPEKDARAIIASINEERRAPWLKANLQYFHRLADYIDLVPDVLFVRGYWQKIQNRKKAGTLKTKSLVLEKRILELAKTHPVFTEAVQKAEDKDE